MNPQYWLDARSVIRQRRYQLAVGANPRAAIEGVIERVVDVDLLVDGVLRVFHVLYCSGIVEAGRIPLASHGREIDEGVGSVAADDPHRNTPAHIPFDGSPVVSAVEINADFFRFTKVESPLEVGRTAPGLDANIHDSLAGAHYSRLIVGISAVYVGDSPQLVVITIGYAAQATASRFELVGKRAGHAGILRRQPSHGVVDHWVGDSLHQARRHRIPDRLVETREHSAVKLAGVGEQMRGIWILLVESDEVRQDDPRKAHHDTPVRDEDLVTIDRYGFPGRFVFLSEPRPLPLIRMTVVVADEHVDFTRREQRSRIDTRRRIGVDLVEQRIAADDLVGAAKYRSFIRNCRVLLELAQHAGELLSEFTEHGVVRHHGDGRRRMENSRHGLNRSGRDGAQGMRSASLIADDIPDDGAPVLLRKDAESLSHRAERPFRAICRFEPERPGLRAASFFRGLQSAVKPSQVENRHLYRRRPQIA